MHEPSFLEYNKRLEFHYRLPDQENYLDHCFDLSPLTLDRVASLSKELLGITDFQTTTVLGPPSLGFNSILPSQVIDVIFHYNKNFVSLL